MAVKRVTTTSKKTCVCEACKGKIPAGDEYERITWRNGGKPCTQILCENCANVIDEYLENVGGEEYLYDNVRSWWKSTKCATCANKMYRCKYLDSGSDICADSPAEKCRFLQNGKCENGSPELCRSLRGSIRCDNWTAND